MTNTGTYKMINGELVKISDRTPGLGHVEAGEFKPFVDRHIDGKPREFTSHRKWVETLRANNMFEVPKDAAKSGFWSDVRKRKHERLRRSDPKKIAEKALSEI